MIDRRSLLKMLVALPIAATTDFEKLLWTPKPQIVVPALPRYLLGTRARDACGSEFIYCQFRQSIAAGHFARFSERFAATPMLASSNGPCGLVNETKRAGDFGWAQIYGRAKVDCVEIVMNYPHITDV